MKRPRGTFVISGMKPRMVVIHKGHFQYYKRPPSHEVSATPPFVKVPPQGQMKGGVSGCTAVKDSSYKDGLSVKIASRGKDTDIILRFDSKKEVEDLLRVFNEHVAYYKDKPIPALNSNGW